MAAVDDLDEVVEQSHLALGEIVKGNPEPLKMVYSHREDVSLANPFVGPPVRGWQQAAATMERAASNYRDGEIVGFERVAKYVNAELAYTSWRWSATRPRLEEELALITLRVTSIFRREDGVLEDCA
jgi:hypothetical protein